MVKYYTPKKQEPKKNIYQSILNLEVEATNILEAKNELKGYLNELRFLDGKIVREVSLTLKQ